MPTNPTNSPFHKAATTPRRLKLFLFGDTGTYKTRKMLEFPNLVVIDLEGGTNLYKDEFNFDILKTNSPDEIMQAVDWLLTNKHNYKSLGIDPFTLYYDALQKKWTDIFLLRNRKGKGFNQEFYTLQPGDWKKIHDEAKDLIRKLLQLDMNVIITAHEKTKYKDGGFMVTDGVTFDGFKKLPYSFDVVVRTFKGLQGKYMGETIKDRSNKLPADTFSVDNLLSYFDTDFLDKEAVPIKMITPAQESELHTMTATLSSEAISSALAKYNASSFKDLTLANAHIIINKLNQNLSTKKQSEPKTTNEKPDKPTIIPVSTMVPDTTTTTNNDATSDLVVDAEKQNAKVPTPTGSLLEQAKALNQKSTTTLNIATTPKEKKEWVKDYIPEQPNTKCIEKTAQQDAEQKHNEAVADQNETPLESPKPLSTLSTGAEHHKEKKDKKELITKWESDLNLIDEKGTHKNINQNVLDTFIKERNLSKQDILAAKQLVGIESFGDPKMRSRALKIELMHHLDNYSVLSFVLKQAVEGGGLNKSLVNFLKEELMLVIIRDNTSPADAWNEFIEITNLNPAEMTINNLKPFIETVT